jgi:hypothetical protein
MELLEQLQQAARVVGTAAKIVGPSANHIDPIARQQVGVERVVDEQQIAHLPAVAVDGDRPARERTDQEMGDPALVLGAELAGAVEAAHAEHDGGQTVHACVVEHVLVGGALGAAIGAEQLERTALVDRRRDA